MIFLIIPIIVIYLLPIKEDKTKFWILFVPFLILTLIRYGIGADYFAYGYIYDSLNTDSLYHILAWQTRYEPLFKVLYSVFKINNIDFTIVNSIISSLIFGATGLWIYRNVKNRTLALVMYITMFYFVWTLSAFRQAIAIVIGLFTLFDKRKLKFKTQAILIVVASLFHYSSLFLLVIMLFNKFKFSKKQILIMMTISVLVSILPMRLLVANFPFIPFREKILQYIVGGIPFLSFGYIVRLMFSVCFLYFYDQLEKVNKQYLDNLLFGFATYFIFSFSPIVAGRLSIYTYILIVAFIPNILDQINYKKIGVIITLAFSTLYYGKEVLALVDQAGMENFLMVPTLLNKEKYMFDKPHYYILDRRANSLKIKGEFESELSAKKHVGYNEEKFNFTSWHDSENGYLIYNDDGDLSINHKMKGSPTIYKDVLTNYYSTEGLFTEIRYIDLSDKDRTEEEMVQDVMDFELNQRNAINVDQKLIELPFDTLPKETKSLFMYPNQISSFELYEIKQPFDYYVMKVNYYHSVVFVILDDEMKPLNELLFESIERFDYTKTTFARYNGLNVHLNSEGKIIWIR